MKLTVKITAILVLATLASPIFMLHGCGDSLNGGQCGGCPDSALPAGATLTALTTLEQTTVDPSGGACYSPVAFIAKDQGGQPMNNVCVEIQTNALIAPHDASSAGGYCAQTAWYTYIRTRTDGSGTIKVDFLISSPCDGLAPGATGGTFWVRAISCAASAESKAAITISSACP